MAFGLGLCGLTFCFILLCSPTSVCYMYLDLLYNWGYTNSSSLTGFYTMGGSCTSMDSSFTTFSKLVIGPSVSHFVGLFSVSPTKKCLLVRINSPHRLVIFYLLLRGNIESNPGPTSCRFPCGVCSKSVKSTQKGILCDICSLWFHASCIGMSNAEYNRLSHSTEDWCCSSCWSSAMPFTNSSHTGFTPDSSIGLDPDITSSTSTSHHHSKSALKLLYTNCRSLLPKLDSLRAFSLSRSPDLVFLSETILDSGISNDELYIHVPGFPARPTRSQSSWWRCCYLH